MDSSAAPARFDVVARALADGTRRTILRLVRDDELPAGALAESFPHMSRPAVSQHLRVLEGAGLVSVRPRGNRRLYRARTEGLTEVWQFIDEMWTDRLALLKQAAEAAERARPQPVAADGPPTRRAPPRAARPQRSTP